ncbi:MAG: hypothetical protein LBM02_03690, partial [Lachnospiraceae bacterium]|nr:hypothetical protein [Lachnospiraceae bacterium]
GTCNLEKCTQICNFDNVQLNQSLLIDLNCFKGCCTKYPNVCKQFNNRLNRYEDNFCTNKCLKYHPGNTTIIPNNDL